MRSFIAIFVALTIASVHAIITQSEIAENSAKGLRLISLGYDADPVWKTKEERLDLKRANVAFQDVTETYDSAVPYPNTLAVSYPTPSHQAEVNAIINQISIARMQNYLMNLTTAFINRYYESQYGADASTWVLDTVGGIASLYPDSGATVAAFTHTWNQSSIIAKVPGTNTSGPITIVSSHLDSINLGDPMNGPAPGADDAGSGVVQVMEAFRVLLASGFKPTTPLEFHWYAAEEEGSLGSQAVAKSYKDAGKDVQAMMPLVLTGYVQPGSKEVIALLPAEDSTTPALNTFLTQIINTYSILPVITSSSCGGPCSDQASWYSQGYSTCMPIEGDFQASTDPYRHSALDTSTVDGFSWPHILEFAKVATAFAYELCA
ncbi:hypothetical protein H0H92_015965 [Tricholoma furcatifolium]|nr:hypothetical protein H0H92_015965 [Tricholoma furcatifolium]